MVEYFILNKEFLVRAQVLSEGSSPLRSGGESIFKLFRRRKYNSMVEYLSFKQRVLGSSPSTFRKTKPPCVASVEDRHAGGKEKIYYFKKIL